MRNRVCKVCDAGKYRSENTSSLKCVSFRECKPPLYVYVRGTATSDNVCAQRSTTTQTTTTTTSITFTTITPVLSSTNLELSSWEISIIAILVLLVAASLYVVFVTRRGNKQESDLVYSNSNVDPITTSVPFDVAQTALNNYAESPKPAWQPTVYSTPNNSTEIHGETFI